MSLIEHDACSRSGLTRIPHAPSHYLANSQTGTLDNGTFTPTDGTVVTAYAGPGPLGELTRSNVAFAPRD